MSEIGDAIHEKCLAFGEKAIKLNDSLLRKAANAKPPYKMVGGKRVYEKEVLQIEVVHSLLKESRESLSWLELLNRNNYLTDVDFKSLYADCDELVKILTHHCKKLDEFNGISKSESICINRITYASK